MTSNGETVIDCGDSQNMQSLSLLMKDKWVNIATSDYLKPIKTTYNGAQRDTGLCQLCIKTSWDLYWHAGTTALMGYYAEFDFETRQLGLTPLSSSAKNELSVGDRPQKLLGTQLWKVIALSLGIFFFLALTVMIWLVAFRGINLFPCFDTKTSDEEPQVAASASSKSGSAKQSELEELLKKALKKRLDKESTGDAPTNSLV